MSDEVFVGQRTAEGKGWGGGGDVRGCSGLVRSVVSNSEDKARRMDGGRPPLPPPLLLLAILILS